MLCIVYGLAATNAPLEPKQNQKKIYRLFQLPSIFHLLLFCLFILVICLMAESKYQFNLCSVATVAATRTVDHFYCSFKHAHLICHKIQTDVTLTSLIFMVWSVQNDCVFFPFSISQIKQSLSAAKQKKTSINYYNKVSMQMTFLCQRLKQMTSDLPETSPQFHWISGTESHTTKDIDRGFSFQVILLTSKFL